MSEPRNRTKYQRPHPALAEIIEAPPLPAASLSPDQAVLALLERDSLPPIEALAQPELRLGGLRIHPKTSAPSRTEFFVGLSLKRLSDGVVRRVEGLPDPVRIRKVAWSPDSRWLAIGAQEGEGLSLWVVDVQKTAAKRLQGPWLHELLGPPFVWMPDSKRLLCLHLLPERGAPPAAPLAPEGPNIEENWGQKRPSRTYQDLLSNPHDEALFTWHTTSKLALVGLDGHSKTLGAPGLYLRASPSPSGRLLLVEALHEPYSYLVPCGRFPKKVEVWDTEGKLVKLLAELPLAEDIPIANSAARKGPRAFTWRADAPEALCWVEAKDQGDPSVEAAVRDKLYLWAAPFDGEPTPWLDLSTRYAGVVWGRGDLALVYESWWSSRRSRAWIAKPDAPSEAPTLLYDRSWEDRYGDPGAPMTKTTPQGREVLRTTPDGGALYLSGPGASPEGNRPFLDKLDLTTLKSERLWRCEGAWYEQPVDVLDDEAARVLVRREAPEVPPNYFVRTRATGELEALTEFEHPSPQLLGATRELIKYTREDGVQLTAQLHLPAGYNPKRDGTLPVLMWAYPREFKDPEAASQVRDSPYRFVHVGWHTPLLWLTRGWAILDDPAMPIVGRDKAEPNDTYISQLVSSAKAAVDELVKRGVGDADRVAVGGHSYGAFMAANLLAHSDLFRAGIARSGAYNRTLTPFGFQSEERTLWQAPQAYLDMSPFMHADRIKVPLLLIHGEADNNTGTYPMQSERFYQALQGHGGVARLVMLPHESHSYRARESILHMVWEMDRWLEQHVRRAPRRGR